MNITQLEQAVSEIKGDLEAAIRTCRCIGREYPNGQKAKEALIRSQRLIMKVHEVTKASLSAALHTEGLSHTIHPPLGASGPELKVTGFIKAKQQDVVALIDAQRPTPETIQEGPLEGFRDDIGKAASEKAIVIGVRSQMSSVAKNFDTLMERAFAETLNLRLRLPSLVMAEVYLLPVVEYDDVAMVSNRVAFKPGFVPVERFIKTFIGISGRQNDDLDASLYKYDRSCLVLVDCREDLPRVFETLEQLKAEGIVRADLELDFGKLSPRGFCTDLVEAYVERHGA